MAVRSDKQESHCALMNLPIQTTIVNRLVDKPLFLQQLEVLTQLVISSYESTSYPSRSTITDPGQHRSNQKSRTDLWQSGDLRS